MITDRRVCEFPVHVAEVDEQEQGRHQDCIQQPCELYWHLHACAATGTASLHWDSLPAESAELSAECIQVQMMSMPTQSTQYYN